MYRNQWYKIWVRILWEELWAAAMLSAQRADDDSQYLLVAKLDNARSVSSILKAIHFKDVSATVFHRDKISLFLIYINSLNVLRAHCLLLCHIFKVIFWLKVLKKHPFYVFKRIEHTVLAPGLLFNWTPCQNDVSESFWRNIIFFFNAKMKIVNKSSLSLMNFQSNLFICGLPCKRSTYTIIKL